MRIALAALWLIATSAAAAELEPNPVDHYTLCVIGKAKIYSRLQSTLSEVLDVAEAACDDERLGLNKAGAKIQSAEVAKLFIQTTVARARMKALVAAADERMQR